MQLTYDFTFLELERPHETNERSAMYKANTMKEVASEASKISTNLNRKQSVIDQKLPITNAERFKDVRRGSLPVINVSHSRRMASILLQNEK